MGHEFIIARDFSVSPGPRLESEGVNSGERCRELIEERLREREDLTIVLDGATGYGSAFLEEVFGGLVRKGINTSLLTIISKEEPYLLDEIKEYMQKEQVDAFKKFAELREQYHVIINDFILEFITAKRGYDPSYIKALEWEVTNEDEIDAAWYDKWDEGERATFPIYVLFDENTKKEYLKRIFKKNI